MKKVLGIIALCLMVLSSCQTKKSDKDFIKENTDFSAKQISLEFKKMDSLGVILNPRTIHHDGTVRYNKPALWTSGFFPGSLWYLYELTGDNIWKLRAEKLTKTIENMQYSTRTHDVGFVIYCSFGNGYRLVHTPEYKQVIINAAKSLTTRFRPRVGCIQSWSTKKGWQAERGWQCPVIIDNMMNLELLFEASKISGDDTFRDIAIKHADTTLKNHYRKDYSSFHVIDYDSITGAFRKGCTAQGFADYSAWARGQAWGLYGYTMCYRETKDPKYLEQAKHIASFILNHPRLPKDMVPYWDFDCTDIPDTYRDASAASVTSSALYELSTFVEGDESKNFKTAADNIMASLASPSYKAKLGENHNFLLMHSVGSIPHNNEIDVPLNYADYYFLESLVRKREIEKNLN
ncbi:glycoside hydrolase family 88 protein [Halosquirtibacter xylanolyticus]|uniref:glycoside hydrolase family 88 protein n=1 Tax=Halosquirtibacter xylanolyticus TaxID=3374599 RepID=UPI0037496EF6|nr:glycoside hydrolase family 88 protein [Prolixibacteraceae bacterium]